RYIGEPVAAVFAEDPYIAEDAADLVDVRVEELPVRLTAEDPPCEFAPGHGSEADIIRKGYGDVAAAFANAHTVIELDLTVGRHSGSPLETRGALGHYDSARDVVELALPSQIGTCSSDHTLSVCRDRGRGRDRGRRSG